MLLLPFLLVMAVLDVVILNISWILLDLYGQKTRRARESSGRESTAFQDAYSRHRFFRWVFLGSIAAGIVLIRGIVLVSGKPYEFDWFKGVHYSFVISVSALIMLALWFDGHNSPSHKVWTHGLRPFIPLLNLTGVYLLYPYFLLCMQ